ncbi:MAG: hypothetical protein IKD46_10180 [Lentisphaeria bacterium]|nr:hypothetical protein [Lentisphaeria bacterium]
MKMQTLLEYWTGSAGEKRRNCLLLLSGAVLAMLFLLFGSAAPETVAESGQSIHAPAIGCAADFDRGGSSARLRNTGSHFRGTARGHSLRHHFPIKLFTPAICAASCIPAGTRSHEIRHTTSLRNPLLLLFLRTSTPARAAPAA